MTIIAHRNAKYEYRNIVIGHQVPWPVVPDADIPVVVMEYPVHAVVEEIVGIHVGRVINRVAGHKHQGRIGWHVDADADIVQSDADADVGRLVAGSMG